MKRNYATVESCSKTASYTQKKQKKMKKYQTAPSSSTLSILQNEHRKCYLVPFLCVNSDVFLSYILPYLYGQYSDILSLMTTCKTMFTYFDVNNDISLPIHILQQYQHSKTVLKLLRLSSETRLHIDFGKMRQRYHLNKEYNNEKEDDKNLKPIDIIRRIHHTNIISLKDKYSIQPFIKEFGSGGGGGNKKIIPLKSIFFIDSSKGENIPIPLISIKSHLRSFIPTTELTIPIRDDDKERDVRTILFVCGKMVSSSMYPLCEYIIRKKINAYVLSVYKYPYKTLEYEDTTCLTRNELYSLYTSSKMTKETE